MLTMLESLVHIPLFQDLLPDQRDSLEPLFERFSCAPETVIFEQGDPAVYLYLILSGVVSIHYKPYDGQSIIITHLTEGDLFGWSAVVGSAQYTSGIVSDTALEAVRMRGKELWSFCLKEPEMGKIILDRLASVVSNRWADAHTQVQSMLDQALAKSRKPRRKRKGKTNMVTPPVHSQEQHLRALLEKLSAYIEQFHGGSVEFAAFDGKTLKVKLGGKCLGCPLLPSTLHGWVAGAVHQFFPEVEVVEDK